MGVAKNLTLEDLAEIMPDVATTLQVPVHTLTNKIIYIWLSLPIEEG